jgi:EAL domain-containing protein (putative c-di-GMP-specific phosphodiesterase class I)
VLHAVCREIAALAARGVEAPPIAVNLSAHQFRGGAVVAQVRAAVGEAGIDPSRLELEITESVLMADAAPVSAALETLRSDGHRIAIDDFGTGYSSLSYLRRLPVDALKIDRSFVRDITTDPEDAAITIAIIGLAHNLKLKVVAEGVETREQLELLAANGCDEMQGNLFSVPTTAEECAKMLEENRRLS